MDDSLIHPASGLAISGFDRSKVRIVLVRARNPNNIGAVARAMHDFGFSDLRVVSEYRVPFESARSAVDASAVLESAVQSVELAEALSGCSLVVGTTAVGERAVQHRLLALEEAGVRIREEAAGRVAMLFGSEKTGLSNEELSFCDLLLTIPMQAYAGLRHASMNLGQAVAVCLWELVRAGSVANERVLESGAASVFRGRQEGSVVADFAIAQLRGQAERAEADEVERVFALLSEVLAETEYARRHAATADAAHIRRLVHRMSLAKSDMPAWLGMLRQMLWKLRLPRAGKQNSD